MCSTNLVQSSSQLVAVEVSAIVLIFVLERRLLVTTHTQTQMDSSPTLANLTEGRRQQQHYRQHGSADLGPDFQKILGKILSLA